jgi:hypothetical protein
MRTVVLDTNVLLADPMALFAFPDDEIVIPETVLGELDKIKTSRVDPDLRFRGREVSRMLFELSEEGDLTEGVAMPDGGSLRVVQLDRDFELPQGLSGRNADDRIVAVALQLCEADCDDVTMVTSDLNMLLKAQTLGLDVERHEGGMEASFSRRYIIRPFQRYKIPLGILALALAVFAAIVVLTIYSSGQSDTVVDIPVEFTEQLTASEQEILGYPLDLEEDPGDTATRLALANTYYDLMIEGGGLTYAQLAVKHYELVLEVEPENHEVRSDLAVTYFYEGQTDRAIQEVAQVLSDEPEHLQANNNLGVFYWRGRRDYTAAAAQFRKVIDAAAGAGPSAQAIVDQAELNLELVIEEAEAAGQPVETEEGT